MYYLQRTRIAEALHLNQQMASVGGQGRNSARQAIMDRYIHILPILASSFGVKRISLMSVNGRVPGRPVPLSVTLHNCNIRLQSHVKHVRRRVEAEHPQGREGRDGTHTLQEAARWQRHHGSHPWPRHDQELQEAGGGAGEERDYRGGDTKGNRRGRR